MVVAWWGRKKLHSFGLKYEARITSTSHILCKGNGGAKRPLSLVAFRGFAEHPSSNFQEPRIPANQIHTFCDVQQNIDVCTLAHPESITWNCITLTIR